VSVALTLLPRPLTKVRLQRALSNSSGEAQELDQQFEAIGKAKPDGSTGTEVRQLLSSLPQTPKRAVLYAGVSTDEQA